MTKRLSRRGRAPGRSVLCVAAVACAAGVIAIAAAYAPPIDAMGAGRRSTAAEHRAARDELVSAAGRFVASLGPELRAKAVMGFDDPSRLAWHYVPGDRAGVRLDELDDRQRMAAHAMLRALLSSEGVLRANAIIELESVLGELENNPAFRDAGRYTVAVFGDVGGAEGGERAADGAQGRWGWRFEGHHLSLNVSGDDQRVSAASPMFWGANPAEVRQGERAGVRVLAAEEELGRAVMASLDAAQLRAVMIAAEAPPDVILGPGRGFGEAPAAGVRWADLTGAQRDRLWALIAHVARNLRGELATEALVGIIEAGLDGVRFGWAGTLERGAGHYYRVRGPTFVIEYDNTQNGANHVHVVWHDLTKDVAFDALRRHYAESHMTAADGR